MNKIMVIYGTRYGSTQEYAEYIAKACEATCISIKEAAGKSLADYDTIVFGGGVYVGKLQGSKEIKAHEEELKNKRCLFFSVGLTSPDNVEEMKVLEENMEKFFGSEWYARLTIRHLQGILQFSKMSFMHRMIMKMMAKAKKKDSNQQDDMILKGQNQCFVDLKTADNIIDWIKN